MRVSATLIVASAFLATAALAAGEPIIDQPIAWVRTPTAADVDAATPAAAKSAHANGKVVLDCHLQQDGRLRGCKPISEEPAGQGFGQAAVGLSAKFTSYPMPGINEREVRLPIAFDGDRGTPKLVIGPQGADYDAIMAKAAADKSVTKVEVMLDCKVGDRGSLTGCAAVSELPKGLGLGELAAQVGPKFVSTLWGANGRPTMGEGVKIPLRLAINDNNNLAAVSKIGAHRVSALSPDLAFDAKTSRFGLEGFYPERAEFNHQAGSATLKCKLAANRTFSDCTVIGESPSGWAFGSASTRLSQYLSLRPDSPLKPADDGTVLLPFAFDGRL